MWHHHPSGCWIALDITEYRKCCGKILYTVLYCVYYPPTDNEFCMMVLNLCLFVCLFFPHCISIFVNGMVNGFSEKMFLEEYLMCVYLMCNVIFNVIIILIKLYCMHVRVKSDRAATSSGLCSDHMSVSLTVVKKHPQVMYKICIIIVIIGLKLNL